MWGRTGRKPGMGLAIAWCVGDGDRLTSLSCLLATGALAWPQARTTGAPQNHWFGPAGDPRGAGIGTPEAIKLVWSCHREIITDEGPIPSGWSTPKAT